jgi:hypothetical protein
LFFTTEAIRARKVAEMTYVPVYFDIAMHYVSPIRGIEKEATAA